MRDDYKLAEPSTKKTLEIEKSIAEKLKIMSEFTKLTEAEIVNTAMKRFIATHKDFFPNGENG